MSLTEIEKIKIFLSGRLLPSGLKSYKGGGLPFVLVRNRPVPTIPQWVLEIRGSHNRRKVYQWVISKKIFLGEISEEDNLLLLILARSILEYKLLLVYKDQEFFEILKERARSLKNEEKSNLLDLSKRIFLGYHPRMDFFSEWRPQTLPAKRYVGIGYKDKGSLGDHLPLDLMPEAEEPLQRRQKIELFESLVRDSLNLIFPGELEGSEDYPRFTDETQ